MWITILIVIVFMLVVCTITIHLRFDELLSRQIGLEEAVGGLMNELKEAKKENVP